MVIVSKNAILESIKNLIGQHKIDRYRWKNFFRRFLGWARAPRGPFVNAPLLVMSYCYQITK